MDFLRLRLNLRYDSSVDNLNESEHEMYLKDLIQESKYRLVIVTTLHTLTGIAIVTSIFLSIVVAATILIQCYTDVQRRIRSLFRPSTPVRYDSQETLWNRTRTTVWLLYMDIWNSDLFWRVRAVSRTMYVVKTIITKIKLRKIVWLLRNIKLKHLWKILRAILTLYKYLPGIFQSLILMLIINAAVVVVLVITLILFTHWMQHVSQHYYLDDDD